MGLIIGRGKLCSEQGGSKVVKHLLYDPKVKGSRPATGTCNVFFHSKLDREWCDLKAG
jgi:hypothetical protein